MESPGSERLEIVTRTARIWLGADGVIHVMAGAGTEHVLADAEEYIVAYGRLWAGTRRPLVVDMTQIKSISREARACYATRTAPYVAAVALVVGSPLSRMIGNFFLGLNRPTQPCKLFRATADAEAWCLQFIEEGTP